MDITLLHYTAEPDNDGDAQWLNYTVYLLVDLVKTKVEFTSYIKLEEHELITKANEYLPQAASLV